MFPVCIRPAQKMFLSLVIMISMIQPSAAQEEDALSLLKSYPPSVLGQSKTNIALMSLRWQRQQQVILKQAFHESQTGILAKLDACQKEIEVLNRELPPAIRFLDEQGRSRMANDALRQLLEAKVEKAVLESTLQQLSEQKPNRDGRDEIKFLEIELERTAAVSKLKSAKNHFANIQQLVKKGLQSATELELSKQSLKVAEAELEIISRKFNALARQQDVEKARKLTEVRISLKPIEAKIQTLEVFLDKLFQAADVIAKIKERERIRGLWEEDLALVAKGLFKSSQKSMELDVFQQLLENERKKTTTVKDPAEEDEMDKKD